MYYIAKDDTDVKKAIGSYMDQTLSKIGMLSDPKENQSQSEGSAEPEKSEE